MRVTITRAIGIAVVTGAIAGLADPEEFKAATNSVYDELARRFFGPYLRLA